MGHAHDERCLAANDGEPRKAGFVCHRDRIANAEAGVTGYMTSLWFESALLPNGWANRVRVTAANGRIGRVTPEVDPSGRDEGLTERRGPGGDSFWTWRELMYQFVERIDPDELEAIASLAYAEMLECGFTQVGEFHYLHHDRGGIPFADPGELAARIVAAAASTGIGLTLLPTFYAHGGFGGAEPT